MTTEQSKLAAAEKLAKRVLAYLEQPNGCPPSSNMECDFELYFLASDFLDAAPKSPALDPATVEKTIREHIILNRFNENEDGSTVIDSSGLILTLSQALVALAGKEGA